MFYPLVLRGVYALFGTELLTGLLFNIFLGLIALWLLYWLGQVIGGQKLARGLAVLFLLWITQLAYTAILASEQLDPGSFPGWNAGALLAKNRLANSFNCRNLLWANICSTFRLNYRDFRRSYGNNHVPPGSRALVSSRTVDSRILSDLSGLCFGR
ncbi:MAG: hypothetical protein H7X77_02360 [Anaerolineae bacterium]|nr:hypothetical protein [Anaerolineae bacterium]